VKSVVKHFVKIDSRVAVHGLLDIFVPYYVLNYYAYALLFFIDLIIKLVPKCG
jgi:hypothetical protein